MKFTSIFFAASGIFSRKSRESLKIEIGYVGKVPRITGISCIWGGTQKARNSQKGT